MKLLSGKSLFWLIIGGILLFWLVLTIIAQRKGQAHYEIVGNSENYYKALVIYNPDLFYNLDVQLCTSFAKGLSQYNFTTTVATVAAAEEHTELPFDLYVFCANTYNWAPDWPTKRLIRNMDLKEKKVVAITLGSGSTARAKRVLEDLIISSEAKLIDSREYWLMRPNDQSIHDKTNIEIAVQMAYVHAMEIGSGITN